MKRILEVQKQIGTLSKNAKNPFFKSAYLDLNDLLKHITPLLQDQGLILAQPIIGNSVTTQIIDSKDGCILLESSLDLPETIKDPQKLGSCITYFRRYTLKSLLAIAEGDDDGNLASKPTPKVKADLTPDRFNSAIVALHKGGTTESGIKAFNLTDLQSKALDIAVKEIKNK